MIFTLGVNTVLRGLMVMLTGGFSPTTMATPPMQFLAKTEVLGIPMAVFVWALLSLGIVFLLTRTPMGRYIYAIGNREAAAYLSGVNTRLVILGSLRPVRAVLGRWPASCSPAIPARPIRRWATPICCPRSPRW